MNIGVQLRKRAELNPGVEALADAAADRRFTFAELDARADQAAHALMGLGLQPGDRVAALLPNGHQFVVAFYAAARAGLVIVPLNWRLVADELAFMLGDSGAAVLLFDADYDTVAAELRDRGGDNGTPVAHWLRAGTGGPAWAADFDAAVDHAPAQPFPADAHGDDQLFIMYTSGTTGLPKGVVHTHDSVQWAVLTMNASIDLRFRDRYLIALPLFHVAALAPLLGCVYRGATTVLLRSFDPQRIWHVFTDERIAATLAVPAMLNLMLATYDPALRESLSLRWIMSGASPVPPSLIAAYAQLGLEIQQVYGLTETCGPGCVIGSDAALTRIGSTGKAFFHTEVRIIDVQTGADAEPGVPGEVLVRGRHLMAGYWNRPEATAETIRDGWLHTGDIAVGDADGFVYIQDRIKDMIISGGENVYPAEIEDVLLSHPGVADVAVLGMPSARWGESPYAVVVRADPDLDEATVFDHCSGRLARFKLPKRAVFVEAIPRTPTGKTLKRSLRDRFSFDAPE